MKTPRLLTHGLAAFLVSSPVFAGPYTWDGGSLVDSNLATAANWNPDGAPPSDLVNTNLAFDGVARLTPNFLVPFGANSLTFNNNAAANPFTFSGNGLGIGTTGIVNYDANPATFGNPVTLGTASTTFNAANGVLTFNNTIALGTGTLNVNGNQATTLAGPIAGTGLINKTGGGTLTLPNATLAADVTVGGGNVVINSAGTTVFSSSSVIAVNAGSFLANGNVALDGAQLTRGAATVTLAAGKTLTIQNGGDAIISGSFIQASAATINVTGPGSTFTMAGGSEFRGGSTLNVTTGGSVSNSVNFIDLANSAGGNATVLVDGAGSSFSTPGGSYWGLNGNTATVTFSNGATGSIGMTDVAYGIAGSTGRVNVLSGASLTTGSFSLASTTDAAAATLTVNGAGSVVTQTAGALLTLGGASGSSATLNVQAGGTFNANATGTTNINATGTLAITGGTFNANGNLFLNGQLTRNAGGAFNLAAGKTLTVQNGGDAIITGGYQQTTAATINVTGTGSTFTMTDGSGFRGGSTLNITAGGRVESTNYIDLAYIGGDATVLVDGAGSSFVTQGISLWGAHGNTATVTFANGANGSIGNTDIAQQGVGTTGTVRVQSGSNLTVGALTLANTAAAATATLTVDGPGSAVTQTAGVPLVVGAASGSVGTLNVQNSGTFNTNATGATTINATGTVAITGGIFNANGNLTLNGKLTSDLSGGFNLAAGKTLTAQNGGDAIFTGGGYSLATAATINVTGVGSTFTASGGYTNFRGGCTLNITAGGSVSTSNIAFVAANGGGGNATVLVDGTGSSLVTPSESYWGMGGNTATVTFANGAVGSSGDTYLANSSPGSVGTVRVQSGAALTVGKLSLANTDTTTATLTVDGPGSVVNQTLGSQLILGGPSGSAATLTSSNGGSYTSGTGSVSLNATGTLTIDGGTVNLAGPLQRNGGVVNFNTGALSIIDNLTVGTGGLLGANVTFDATRRFTTSATTTIDAFHTLTLTGGTFSTGALVNHGTLAFNTGTLAITGVGGFTIGSGALGANVVLGTGANLQVSNTATIASGAALTLNGGTVTVGTLTNFGTFRANLGTATIGSVDNNSGGRIFIGDLLNVTGGLGNAVGGRITLEDGSGLLFGEGTLGNEGLLTGAGTVMKTLKNSTTGEVRGESGKTLFFTGKASNNGAFNLLGGTLDFADAVTNDATGFISGRGALFTGGLTNSGQMAFAGGNTDLRGDVTLTAGSRVATSGAGSVTVFYDDVVHNGNEIYTGAGASTVFFGSLSGTGPYTGGGTVYFTGDLRPGNSPAVVTFSPQIVFSPSNGLTMEIGGRVAGTGYDKLVFTNPGASQLTWGGTLVVELINGFTPVAGDAFHVFDFDPARAAGTFATVTVVSHGLLPAGLAFDFTELYTTGILRVVSTAGATFGQWAATALGNPGALPGGDHDGDGSLNLMEYALALYPVVPGTFAPIGELHAYPDGTRLRLRFWRPLDRSDITIRVQGSADMATWDDLAVSVNSAPFTGAGFVSENRAHPVSEPGLVDVRDILTPSAAAHRFLRIVVTLSP
jgi:hypothetical protein